MTFDSQDLDALVAYFTLLDEIDKGLESEQSIIQDNNLRGINA